MTGTPFWLTVAAALGLGSLLGSLATTISGLIRDGRQRAHELAMREADRAHERQLRQDEHRHDLTVREEEDARRRRDARLQRLQEGLASIVSAALDFRRMGDIAPMRDPGSDKERRRLLDSANAEYLKAHSTLLLDPDGRTLVADLEAIERSLRQYGILVDYQEHRVEAGHADTEDRQEGLDWHYGQLRTGVDKLVEDCRALIERVATSTDVTEQPTTQGGIDQA
jgi:hypothetical protein